MFEAYRIRPVLEWEESDGSRELKPFLTLNDAVEAQTEMKRFEPHLFWTLYGVNPECEGVRTEDAVADVDTEEAALTLLEKLIGRFHADPRAAVPGYYVRARRYAFPSEEKDGDLLTVSLTFPISLSLLKVQKRALVNLMPGVPVTPEQDEAVEGILNLLDFIQDSILEQGLAGEDEIFESEGEEIAS